jgi:hypothetical protein
MFWWNFFFVHYYHLRGAFPQKNQLKKQFFAQSIPLLMEYKIATYQMHFTLYILGG